MILFERFENVATVFYWKQGDFIVEPPYELTKFWRVTKVSRTGAGDFERNFVSATEAKGYIQQSMGSGPVIFSRLYDSLAIMDRAEKKREQDERERERELEQKKTDKVWRELEGERKEEDMSFSPNGGERYEEVGRFPSKSTPAKYYTVQLDSTTGDYSCDCKPWIFNQRKDRTCSHTDKLVGNKRATPEDNPTYLSVDEELKLLELRGKAKEEVSTVSAIRSNPRKRKLML